MPVSHRRQRDDARKMRWVINRCSFIVLVELLHLEADVVNEAVDLRALVLIRPRHFLQRGDAGLLGLLEI